MKNRIFKLLAVGLIFTMICGTASAVGSNAAVVSLRIEGMNQNLYYNSVVPVSNMEKITLSTILSSLSSSPDIPQITVMNEKENSRITQIGALKEKCLGSPFDDCWMIRVNGKNAGTAPDVTEIRSGDEIVIYYGDPALMQYPEIDLKRLITDGIVKITGDNTAVDDKGNIDITKKPVGGATVTWDGMKYTTDSNGEIIIDSTGAGVRHTIQIERYDSSGLPTVLRLAPGYFVKYGFEDVTEGEWYYDSVMFVSDRYLLCGISEKEFAPVDTMNRAMFVTVLGRLTDAVVDQTGDTGFPDVKNDGWSAGYITWAIDNGIVSGFPDGTFGQYMSITREQIATLLFRYAAYRGYSTELANSDLSAYTDSEKISGYAVNAMRWASGNGIMTGSGGHLNPLGPASRAEVASILERFILAFCR